MLSHREEVQLKRLAQLAAAQFAQYEIFSERNQKYGDAIRVGGVLGAAMELLACAARVHTLLLDRQAMDMEAIRDSLLDAANYGSIGMMLLEDGNMWGGLDAPGPKEKKEDSR